MSDRRVAALTQVLSQRNRVEKRLRDQIAGARAQYNVAFRAYGEQQEHVDAKLGQLEDADRQMRLATDVGVRVNIHMLQAHQFHLERLGLQLTLAREQLEQAAKHLAEWEQEVRLISAKRLNNLIKIEALEKRIKSLKRQREEFVEQGIDEESTEVHAARAYLAQRNNSER
ncbi:MULTISPECIES: hypothetical protein [unclassified Caballeronia]|uniref:hypothetical protein n=1 Tax=unclassified Caballeronia TaxID=2646786 RepID=UPI0020291F40